MRYQELLIEGKNQPVIVVDVQPAYTGVDNIFGSTMLSMVPKLMEFLNQQARILMFVNAEDQQLTDDRIIDIKDNWESAGFDSDNWPKVEIVDKGYGYLRSWIDYLVDDAVIIKTIREMYKQKVNDSRMLFDGDESESYITDMSEKLGVPEEVLDDAISVEWTSVAQLKKYGGGYIVGGGRNECLKEVELLMSAFNIKAKQIEAFIYG